MNPKVAAGCDNRLEKYAKGIEGKNSGSQHHLIDYAHGLSLV